MSYKIVLLLTLSVFRAVQEAAAPVNPFSRRQHMRHMHHMTAAALNHMTAAAPHRWLDALHRQAALAAALDAQHHPGWQAGYTQMQEAG
mmetsp:Transcript_87060/g.154155  ORF Transcript_87060/g.154155 Transcript_87060/m.154155 type:complete len:89 (+) Transcript_87060:54-320(+)